MFLEKGQRIKVKGREELEKDPSIIRNYDGSYHLSNDGRIMNKIMLNYKFVIAPETYSTNQFYYDGWQWESWMLDCDLNSHTIMETE